MIVKLFGKDAEVKTNAELRDYIKKEILKQKQESLTRSDDRRLSH